LGFERARDRYVGQRAVARLPGGEGEQACWSRHITGFSAAQNVGPKKPMRLTVLRIHPRPGVVTHTQVGETDCQPCDFVMTADPPAVTICAYRGAHRSYTFLDHRAQNLTAPGARTRDLRDTRRCPVLRTERGLAHGYARHAAQWRYRLLKGRAVGQRHVACERHLGSDGIGGYIERNAVSRAAAQILTKVGPIPAVLDAKHFA